MTLIKNISGFRGTIGGENSENLTPLDIVYSVSAFSKLIYENNPGLTDIKVMTGREMVGNQEKLFITLLIQFLHQWVLM